MPPALIPAGEFAAKLIKKPHFTYLRRMDVKIEDSWKQVLKPEFAKPYFGQVTTFLKTEKMSGAAIYPPGSLIFNAFNTTPFEKVKIVLLGQDPYHGPGQAHGLSFSVPKGIPPPPSSDQYLQGAAQRYRHVCPQSWQPHSLGGAGRAFT